MKKSLHILMVVILAFSGMYASVCNTNEKYSILQSWQKYWGSYEWGEDPQVNQYYIVETNGAVKDMLRACDMIGLEQIFRMLRKDAIMQLQRAEGSYLDIVLKENINPLVVKFLLDNNLILFEDLDPIDYKHLATQKLQESKAKKDSKALINYEKIIKLLQEHGIK